MVHALGHRCCAAASCPSAGSAGGGDAAPAGVSALFAGARERACGGSARCTVQACARGTGTERRLAERGGSGGGVEVAARVVEAAALGVGVVD